LKQHDRQSGQNDTDEPPSLFLSIDTGAGSNRQPDISFLPTYHEFTVFLISKNRFSGNLRHIQSVMEGEYLPSFGKRCSGEDSEKTVSLYESEGFIIRDERGRIKTIIFKKQRSM
jgi:hypothetical protein